MDSKAHWDNIYSTKQLHDVSWYEPVPETSLAFLHQLNVPKSARIIDIGGGDSFFVDYLLEKGYTDITVLDISEKALERAQERLGEEAKKVKWIVTDAAKFKPTQKYDFWHDRAAFHFLTDEDDIESYIRTMRDYIKPGGHLVLGTFSEEGPKKCSGIEIRQYSEKAMTERLTAYFEKVKCITVNHETPFQTTQNFIFCSFKRS